MSTEVLEIETPSKEKCLRCENTGFIIWVMMMTPQGPQRYEIRPGDANIDKVKPKDMTIEKCDCVLGNDFAVIKDK